MFILRRVGFWEGVLYNGREGERRGVGKRRKKEVEFGMFFYFNSNEYIDFFR